MFLSVMFRSATRFEKTREMKCIALTAISTQGTKRVHLDAWNWQRVLLRWEGSGRMIAGHAATAATIRKGSDRP